MYDDEQLDARIDALEVEEREVSARRRKIHDRLASFPNEVMLQQEREISAHRRELHAEIDSLKAERSRRREEQLRLSGRRFPPSTMRAWGGLCGWNVCWRCCSWRSAWPQSTSG